MKFNENINITKTIKFTNSNLMNIPLDCKKKREKIPLRHNSIFAMFPSIESYFISTNQTMIMVNITTYNKSINV